MPILVGMGPGHIKHVTLSAIEAIEKSTVNIAFGRIAETAREITSNIIKANNLSDVILHATENKNSAILASGDACFFGILDYLKKQNISIDRVIPGISSFQYMMSELQMSWHTASFFSLHGRDPEYEQITRSKLSVILTDKINTPDLISATLAKKGANGTIYTGTDLSYPTEKILHNKIGDTITTDSNLATVIISLTLPE